jgi:hypothetical protein
MRQAREIRNAQRMMEGKHEGKRTFGRHNHGWEAKSLKEYGGTACTVLSVSEQRQVEGTC